MSSRRSAALSVSFISIAIVLFVLLTIKVWMFGDSEKDYSITCLGGYQYWRANYGIKAMLALRVDAEGRPVSCQTPTISK